MMDDSRKPASGLTWALRIGGTVVFVLILIYAVVSNKLDFGRLLSILGNADWRLTIFSILLIVPFVAVKSGRWRAILQTYGINLSIGQAWRIYAIGLGAGQFTPGQAGDVIKAWYLKAMGYPLSAALLSTVVDRLFDVVMLGLLTLEGVIVFWQSMSGDLPVVIALIAGSAIALVALGIRPVRERLWRMVMSRINKGKAADEAAPATEVLHHRRAFAIACLLTVASFAVSISRVWLMCFAVGLNVGPLEIIGINALTTAAALIPISVGGVGTRDLLLIALFGILFPGINATVYGVAVSTLILLLNISNTMVGYAIWFRYPARLEEVGA